MSNTKQEELKNKTRDELDDLGYGQCDECEAIHEIGRGENFFWHEKKNKWHCQKCAEKYPEGAHS